MRFISIFLRNRKDNKRNKQTISKFTEWSNTIINFPNSVNYNKSIGIVRLDDIGDYILFRNFLIQYKNSKKYEGYTFTLIGNIVWKEIFKKFDAFCFENIIWVNKNTYFSDETYRTELLKSINDMHFSEVICTSRTRPLLLDDIIALATGAKIKTANNNTYACSDANAISDKIYNRLFKNNFTNHEFLFNQQFTNWVLEENQQFMYPELPKLDILVPGSKVICFIGTNAKSKHWPVKYWIMLIKLLINEGYEPVIAGGKQEEKTANKIIAATKCESIVAKTSILETLQWIAESKMVITGDTMAAHVAASYKKNTIILSNGINANRFVAYEQLNLSSINIVYTNQYEEFLKNRKLKNNTTFFAVSKDMKTIKPNRIFALFNELIKSD